VRLLLDQNLSRLLVGQLAQSFPESSHVAALGLETATDREIWTYAGTHDYVIVSKDSDFRQLAFLLGPPPKAVWVRVGNCSTSADPTRCRPIGCYGAATHLAARYRKDR